MHLGIYFQSFNFESEDIKEKDANDTQDIDADDTHEIEADDSHVIDTDDSYDKDADGTQDVLQTLGDIVYVLNTPSSKPSVATRRIPFSTRPPTTSRASNASPASALPLPTALDVEDFQREKGATKRGPRGLKHVVIMPNDSFKTNFFRKDTKFSRNEKVREHCRSI